MIYCKECGAEVKAGAKFCKQCGAKLSADSDVVESSVLPEAGKRKAGFPKIIILAVLIVAFLAILLGGRRGWKKTLDMYVKMSSGKGNVENMWKLLPEEMIEYAMEEDDMTKREVEKEVKEDIESLVEDAESYYGEYKVSYEVADKEIYSDDELKDLNDELYYDYDFSKKETVKKAMTVTVDIVWSGTEDEREFSLDIEMIKIGKKWYIYDYV